MVASPPQKPWNWSVVVYDPQTRSELQTPDQPYPSNNSNRDGLVYHEDDSVDLYFGPTASDGKPEANWTQTVSGKSWFVLLRLYGLLQLWFDKIWAPVISN